MQIIGDGDLNSILFHRTSIALGNFDGVHLGHKRIIFQAIELAEESGGESLIFTFHPHPLEILKGDKVPRRLSSLKEKIDLVKELAPDYLFIKDFNLDFSAIDHYQFIEEYLHHFFKAKYIVVGKDFSFGRGGCGRVQTLKEMEKRYGYQVKALDTVKIDGIPVKSTFIREMIVDGKIEEVEKYLGRPFSLRGTVVKGFGRGHMLGFPTANIIPPKKLITPPEGVYVVEVLWDGTIYPGVANVGFCPTFKDHQFTIEVHLLNYSGDLYEKEIRVFFLKRIRGEIAFSSEDALKERVKDDVLMSKEILKKRFSNLV